MFWSWKRTIAPAVVAAIVLTLPSLRAGLLFDDYHHKLVMQGTRSPATLLHSRFDLFRFLDGNPEHTQTLIDHGICPWWTNPGIKAAFFRPLASLTHWVDYQLWPSRPWLMHAQSIAWYALLAAVVALFYRGHLGVTGISALAGLLFAIDDAHSMPVMFLANRNALIATVFGVLALIAHDRWRRELWRGASWRSGAVLGPVLLAASLLSAEAGTGTLAYLFAYTVFLDPAPWKRRVIVMSPYVAVTVAWRLAWNAMGCGVANLGLYVDPVATPGPFAAAAVRRLPVLMLGHWAGVPAELGPFLPSSAVTVIWAAGTGLMVLLAVIFAPMIRRGDRTTGFFFTGMILSALPVCATLPADRLLLFPGIGAMGLVAMLLAAALGRSRDACWSARWRRPMKGIAGVLAVIHLVLAPISLPVRSMPLGAKSLAGDLWPEAPLDKSVEQQTLVLVNPPMAFFTMASPLTWASEGQPMPKRIRTLTSSRFQNVSVSRPGTDTLVVRPDVGFLAGMLDGLFRGENRPFTKGERIELAGMTARVTEMNDEGRPAEVEFRFDVPLDDPSLRWLRWEDKRIVPFTPPPVGETVVLSP